MLSPKPTPSEQQQSDAHAAALQAYRDGRVKTFDAWLERSHQTIFEISGVQGIHFPDDREGLRVRTMTNEAAWTVKCLLAFANIFEGIDVDPERYEVVRVGESLTMRFVLQSKKENA